MSRLSHDFYIFIDHTLHIEDTGQYLHQIGKITYKGINMFYTHLAKIASAIILFLGTSRVLLGFIVISSDDSKQSAALFLGRHTSGEAIDQGFFYILIALALGVLTEISIAIHKRTHLTSNEDQER